MKLLTIINLYVKLIKIEVDIKKIIKKAYLILCLLFCIFNSLAFSSKNNIDEDDHHKKKSSICVKLTSSKYDDKLINEIISKIYNNNYTDYYIKKINIEHLFVNLYFETYTLEQLLVYLRIMNAKKLTVSQNFVSTIIDKPIKHDPIIQYILSILYQKGEGIKQDVQNSLLLLTQSANQGYAPAQNNLGLIYQEGIVKIINRQKANNFFLQSANQGYAPAQNNLGIYYCEIQRDYKKAFEYFLYAANQGYAAAQYHLGMMHAEGIGTKKDIPKAIELYTQASKQGHAPSANNLGIFYEKATGTKQDSNQATKFFLKSIKYGSDIAKENIKFYFQPVHTQIINQENLSQSQIQEISTYQENLDNIQDFLEYYLGQFISTDNKEMLNILKINDKIGYNQYLSNSLKELLENINLYKLFLKKIDSPGFHVSLIQPKNQNQCGISNFVDKIDSNEIYYCSWTGHLILKKIYKDLLKQNIQEFFKNLTFLIDLFSSNEKNKEHILSILQNLEIDNKMDLYNCISDLFRNYLSCEILPLEFNTRYDYLGKFFKQFKKDLEDCNIKTYTDNLYEYTIDLLCQTQNYRDSIFKQRYAWFFQDSDQKIK